MKRTGRKIREHRYTARPVTVDAEFVADPVTWLAGMAAKYELTTLLAHANDGVIWGQMAGGRLALSSQAFPSVSPRLEAITLQQARLFGEEAELLVWRDGDGAWRARLLDDRGTETDGWCFDEAQLQWGDRVEAGKDGFTLVSEGQEGLRHAAPLPFAHFDPADKKRDRWHPLRLGVRHYLERDADGTLVAVQGRLTRLWSEGRTGGSNG